ncbi:uncharacterized protein LOC121873949 [Homarus americanus]|uniref:uncharacterized protein LOC121873949 n=1 Tax=Homarus americanus TaxID=6706 RepID=UPI001C46CE7D|nr:uncharacterized protein LOC121873949 [Homarus americanus]
MESLAVVRLIIFVPVMDKVYELAFMFVLDYLAESSDSWWWERVVLAVWMLMTLVLTRSYAGNLMSLLAVRHIPEPYQSIDDFLRDPTATMIWQAGSSFKQYIYSAETGTYLELTDLEKQGRIIYSPLPEHPRLVDTLVRRGDHVLNALQMSIRVYMAEEFSRAGRCPYYASREAMRPRSMAMIGQKGSPLVSALSKRITAMTEAGLFYQWMKMDKPKSTICDHEPRKISVMTSLALSNLWGMFVILVAGFVVGLLVLFIEFLMAFTSQ